MKNNFLNNEQKSLKKHEQDLTGITNLTDWHDRQFKDGDMYKQFEVLGYEKILKAFPQFRNLHIDIGCGGGWLVNRTSEYFSKVIGVEPSNKILEVARSLNKDKKNVEFLNLGMAEALKKINPQEPTFLTTCTVFSHIEDRFVEQFLKDADSLPNGSLIFFGEYYGYNSQRPFWYIRSKEWWAKNLPNWQLIFNTSFLGKSYGICGIRVGQENVLNNYKFNSLEKIIWMFSGFYNKLKSLGYFIRKFLKLVK